MNFSRFAISSLATLLFAAHAYAQAPAPVPSAAPAPAAAPAASGPVTRDQLPALVREAILNDPEIIKDAIQKLREKADNEARQKAEEGLSKNKDAIFNDPTSPVAGNPNGDVTVVEFFDYNCGHCRNVVTTVSKLLEEDPKLRFVFKEYPIFGGDSDMAAKAGLAVHSIAKDKYFKFHSALLNHKGNINNKAIMEVAKKVGINTDKLKAEMEKPEIAQILEKNHALGGSIGIRGTPAFIIGNEVIPGAISLEELKEKIAALRGSGSAAPAPVAAPAPAAAR